MSQTQNFTIDTAVAPVHMDEILEFIYKYYLVPKPESFLNIGYKEGRKIRKTKFHCFKS